MKAPDLSQAEGILLIGGIVVLGYLAYKAYGAASTVASNVSQGVQTAVTAAGDTVQQAYTGARSGTANSMESVADAVTHLFGGTTDNDRINAMLQGTTPGGSGVGFPPAPGDANANASFSFSDILSGRFLNMDAGATGPSPTNLEQMNWVGLGA